MIDVDYSAHEALDDTQIEQLHALYQGEWWTHRRTLDDVRRMLDGSDYVFAFCAKPNGQLVAFARVLTDGVFKAFILDVIVAPDVRDKGLGRRLMDRIVGHPVLRQVRHLELYCLPELVPFYEKWGFSTYASGVAIMRREAS